MSNLEDIGIFVFELLIRGLVLLIIGYVLVLLARFLSASHRHWLWTTLFVSILLIPTARIVPPILPIDFPTFTIEADPGSPADLRPSQGAPAGSESIGIGLIGPTPTVSVTGEIPVSSQFEGPLSTSVAVSDMQTPSGFALLGWIWVLGFLFLIGRAVREVLHLNRIAAAAKHITSGPWFESVQVARKQLGVRRKIVVISSEEIDTPMTWGAIHPTVAYPADSEFWSEQRIEIAALHEMLHIQRWDYVTHCIGWITTAIHWLNPLAWWALKEMLFERERACDDGVVRSGIRSTDYAHELVLLARQIIRPTLFTKPHMTMKYSTTLKQRVEALLKPDQNRSTIGSIGRFGFSMFTLAALLVMAPLPEPQTSDSSTGVITVSATTAGFGFGKKAVDTIEPMLLQLSVVAEDDTTGLARKLRELKKRLEELKRNLVNQEATLNEFTVEMNRMQTEGFSAEDERELKERIAVAEREIERATENLHNQLASMDVTFTEPVFHDQEQREQALAELRESMAQMKLQFESPEWKQQLEQQIRVAQEEMQNRLQNLHENFPTEEMKQELQQQLQSMQENFPSEEMKQEMEQLRERMQEQQWIHQQEIEEAINRSRMEYSEQTKQQMEIARRHIEALQRNLPSEEEMRQKISEAMEEARRSVPTQEIIKAEMQRLQQHLQELTEKLQQMEIENENQ